MSNHPTTADQPTAVDSSPTASRSESIEESTACPLCAYTADSRNGIYTHLLTGHRKSAISELLLECQQTETVR